MAPSALGDLVGIGEVNLGAMRDARRTQRGLPAANHGLRDGDGEKEVGFANVVVVEES